jgi:DNA polymerase-1
MAATKLKKFILVDGNALVYRAFHALPPLTTKSGELVNAVYGFTTLLLKAIQDIQPDYAAVTFDVGKTFRHEQYTEYKANRVKMPDELFNQFDRVKEVVTALNIPIFTAQGFEADDVIGTLSVQAKKHNIETIIVTGDMDTLQLVNPFVKVYTARKSFTDTVLYDEAAVEERYGLTPKVFVDFKALKGDASDNIPGVAGIGEKTAATLIQAFGSLDKLYEFLETKDLSEAPVKITPRIKDILLTGKEQAYQSQHLSRIVCDVPVALDLKLATVKDYDRQKAVTLFQQLEFRTLVAKLPAIDEDGDIVVPSQPANSQQASLFGDTEPVKKPAKKVEGPIVSQVKDKKYHLINTEKALEELVQKLGKAKRLVVDTETDNLNGPIIGFSFAIAAGEAWYVPVVGLGKMTREEVVAALKPILEDPEIEKIGHNIKYDYLSIRKEGIILQPLTFDTMLASYMIKPNNRQHGLDAVVFVELGIEMIPISDLIGPKKLDSLANVEVEKVAEYAAEDADMELRLYEIFHPQLEKGDLKKVFYEIEMPLVPILGEMEAAGIKVDTDYLGDLSKRLTKRQTELITQIYEHAGQEFNINSTQQLAVILFDKLQLAHPDMKKTKTGFSTAASELEKLRGVHPIVDLLFEYRELTKLLSTYVNTLPLTADKNSRIHTTYSQIGAATGRFSSNDPNLQNIPIRTELGREIRKSFVADKGMKLLSVDYSQIELRVVAHLANDASLIKAFADGRDIHQEVADTLGVDRRVGKTLNFAVLYGQGAYSTAYQLGVKMAQAKEYIDQYFKTYSGVRRFLDETLVQAKKLGYVETVFGRRRYIPEINSSNFAVRGGAERMATNMPVQGTAADIMKLAMIKVAHSDLFEKYGTKMLLQVHDELVFEVPEEYVDDVAKEVKKMMETVHKFKTPLLAEAKVGDSWGEMEKLEL